jgi:hypothetical protein
MDQEATPARKRTRTPKRKVTKPATRVRAWDNQREEASTYKVTAYPYIQTGKLLAALSDQRGREKETELHRQATDIGSLFVAISGEPGLDGLYGTLTTPELAKRIRPYVVAAVDWLAQNGSPVQTGGPGALDLGLLALLQQGMTKTSMPAPARPAPPLANVAEAEDLFLSDTQETALALDDGGGFL